MTRDIIIAVITLAGAVLLVPAALGLRLAAASWFEDRAMARLRACPGGIVAWEAPEPWSDGTVSPHRHTRYAADGYELRELLAALPHDVNVIPDEAPEVRA